MPSWVLVAGLATASCAELESGLNPVPPPAPEDWHVSGGALRAPDGRAVILRGVNLAGAHKTAPYFGFHQLPDFQRVRADWGMNSIRLLILWAAIEPTPGVYDEAYLDQVERRLDWAWQANLHVVLDMHQDVYGEGFGGDGAPRWTCDEAHYEGFEPISPWFLNYQNEHVIACFDALWTSDELMDHYAGAWRRVAERFAEHEAVVGFDVMNEPHWGSTIFSFEEDKLQPFYERVVKAVRQPAPHWVAFLEPSASRNIGLPTGLTPFSFPNVVYAPHGYDTEAEQGNGFDYSRREALLTKLSELRADATMLGAALWIGEYGGTAESPGITAYMDAEYDGQGAVAAGSAYWAYDRDGGYGLLHPDGTEKAVLLDVIVRPYPMQVAGDPVSFAFDEASRTFTLKWRPDPAIEAPTEIAVPTRTYPAGYSVACESCATERRPGRVLVTHVPAAEQMTLVLAPSGD
ncbi:MAG: cellulase family glycosylhydrolase [Deltaproteobacteria bacterium]|nr:cellulase family glycosylhydrolase [Deltaproteobacteria bacterium]